MRWEIITYASKNPILSNFFTEAKIKNIAEKEMNFKEAQNLFYNNLIQRHTSEFQNKNIIQGVHCSG